MRDPRVEPRVGDVLSFEDGEVITVTSANRWWIKFNSSAFESVIVNANHFRKVCATATIIHAEGD